MSVLLTVFGACVAVVLSVQFLAYLTYASRTRKVR